MPPVIRGIQYRIIPARAGPTRAKNWLLENTPDHPRSCGANVFVCCVLYCSYGSSPLVRGQHAGIRHGHGRLRIIPARAGPTKYFRATHGSKTDHPRSCGANWAGDTHCACKVGSSPLVRGQPVRIARRFNATRIIPARAGPTLPVTALSRGSADHPRSCGANQSDVSK